MNHIMKPALLFLLLVVMAPMLAGCNDRLIPPDGFEDVWSGRAVVYNGFDILRDDYGPIYMQPLDSSQGKATQVVLDGYVTYPGRGGAFLYVADHGSGPVLYIHDNAGDRVLVNGPGGPLGGRVVAVLSNDGRMAAYLQREGGLDTALYLYTISTTIPAAIPERSPISVGEVRSMLFSPDGNYIAMSVVNTDGFTEDVHIYDRNSRELTARIDKRLPDVGLGLQFIYWFQWTSDSRGIVYRATDPLYQLGIFMTPVDGGPKQPVALGGEYIFPAPSLDGRHMAAIRDNQLWLMDADGSNPRQVTNLELGLWEILLGPQWSADGSKLLINRANVDLNDTKAVVEVLDVATGRRRSLARIEAPGLWLE